GAVVDFLLELEHVLAAGLELGQQPLDFLFAELLQDFLEAAAGLFEGLDGLVLLVGGVRVVLCGGVLFGLLLVVGGVLDPLPAIVGRALVAALGLTAGLAGLALLALLSRLGLALAALARLAFAALGFARLAFARLALARLAFALAFALALGVALLIALLA